MVGLAVLATIQFVGALGLFFIGAYLKFLCDESKTTNGRVSFVRLLYTASFLAGLVAFGYFTATSVVIWDLLQYASAYRY